NNTIFMRRGAPRCMGDSLVLALYFRRLFQLVIGQPRSAKKGVGAIIMILSFCFFIFYLYGLY
ncbi:hypothetical protein, partial [Candidatus Hakubella thermalkaliphila]|uniref:hypothetical protein n=1 Tax=Candidatus Hakubella thermalkaliphila TaxID=2754717 RepID=UPI001C6132C4